MSPKAAGWMLTFLLLLPIFLFLAPLRDARAQGPDGPTLLDVSPARNAVTASVTTTITARYDQPMAAASVVSRTFVVHGMQSGVITQMHGLADTTTLQVTPNRSLHQGANSSMPSPRRERPISPARIRRRHPSGSSMPARSSPAAWGALTTSAPAWPACRAAAWRGGITIATAISISS